MPVENLLLFFTSFFCFVFFFFLVHYVSIPLSSCYLTCFLGPFTVYLYARLSTSSFISLRFLLSSSEFIHFIPSKTYHLCLVSSLLFCFASIRLLCFCHCETSSRSAHSFKFPSLSHTLTLTHIDNHTNINRHIDTHRH